MHRAATSFGFATLLVAWLLLTPTAARAACPVDAPDCCETDDTCDDGNACTTDTCDLETNLCTHTAVGNGTPCPDLMFCNGSDVCFGGTCRHAGDPCEGDGECSDVCDEATDSCFAVADTPCTSDADTCTTDVCDGAGHCTHPVGTSETCDDGDACTTGDHCGQSGCEGTPTVCTAADICHGAGTCNPSTGVCSNPALPNNTPCPDALFCNGAETCQAGTCVSSGDPCADGSACQDQCNETTDSCLVPSGTACTTDGNACTADVCDAAGHCTHTAVLDIACDDDDACTTGDTCTATGCAGTPRTCTAIDVCHGTGTCNPQTGACSTPVLADDTPCPDQLYCNGTERCVGGACTSSGNPCDGQPECSNACDESADSCLTAAGITCGPPSSSPCTVSACNGAGECVTTLPSAIPCDDGDLCTVADQCSAGLCHGSPKTCSAITECQLDGVCNPATGQCDLPTQPDETPCGTDGHACTVDRCRGGLCEHTPDDTRCDDGTCQVGVCNPAAPDANPQGCITIAATEGADCTDDGIACTTDVCQAGACSHLPTDARCGSTDECANAICSPERGDATGCAPAIDRAEGNACSEDNDACSDDICHTGTCSHTQVASYATCQPVQGVWDRVRTLAGTTRALQAGVRGANQPSSDPLVRKIEERLEILADALEAAGATLAGRAPADAPISGLETNGQRRARTALKQLTGVNAEIALIRRLVNRPAVRTTLGAEQIALFKKDLKTLRRGVRLLTAELRRLRKFSKSIAR